MRIMKKSQLTSEVPAGLSEFEYERMAEGWGTNRASQEDK